MRQRTIIIGMNNPHCQEARYALYPAPEGCAGHRLWGLLHARTGATKGEYIKGFERLNLVDAPKWEMRTARRTAQLMLEDDTLEGRRIVLLGTSVRTAFRLPPVLVKPVVVRGVTFRQLPHPSGRCRWYNDPKHRAIAGMLLEEEMRR